LDLGAEVGQQWYIAAEPITDLDSIRPEVLARGQIEIDGHSLVQLALKLGNANPKTGVQEFENPITTICV
jgi:hypothetical protein